MKRFRFTERQTVASLRSGATLVYFNETEGQESNQIINESTGKKSTEKTVFYEYSVAEIPAGIEVNKGAIVDAIIRTAYTQADVEAIFRHKLNGGEGADAEFDAFDAFAEAAKVRANEILGNVQ